GLFVKADDGKGEVRRQALADTRHERREVGAGLLLPHADVVGVQQVFHGPGSSGGGCDARKALPYSTTSAKAGSSLNEPMISRIQSDDFGWSRTCCRSSSTADSRAGRRFS